MKIRPASSFLLLDESMSRVVEVYTYAELLDALHNMVGNTFDLDTLGCEEYGYDDRIKWNTHLLTADMMDGSYKKQAVAFADGSLDSLDSRKDTPMDFKEYFDKINEISLFKLKAIMAVCELYGMDAGSSDAGASYFSDYHGTHIGVHLHFLDGYNFEKRIRTDVMELALAGKFNDARERIKGI